MTVMAEGESKDVPLREFAMSHVALIASAGVVLFGLLRVYWVAGSLSNADEMIRALGPGQILSATLLMAVPLVPPLLLMYVIAERGLSGASYGTAAIAFMAIAVTPPALLLVLIVYLPLIMRARRRGLAAGRSMRRPRVSDFGPFLIVAGLFNLLLVWLPTERVVMGDNSSLVGYVIEADSGGFMSVLRRHDRKLLRFPTDEVSDRQLCNPYSGWYDNGWYYEPLVWHAFDGEPPDCPSD